MDQRHGSHTLQGADLDGQARVVEEKAEAEWEERAGMEALALKKKGCSAGSLRRKWEGPDGVTQRKGAHNLLLRHYLKVPNLDAAAAAAAAALAVGMEDAAEAMEKEEG